jgi:hypothetical protein
VLKTIGALLIAAVLALVSGSAIPQVFAEFGDTEPGSLLFGTLQLVIATSAAVATVGVLRRTRWAAPSIAVCGIGATGLLLLQPVYTPMALDARQGIWFGAAVVGAAAMLMGWGARRLARPAPSVQATAPSMVAPAPYAPVAGARLSEPAPYGHESHRAKPVARDPQVPL